MLIFVKLGGSLITDKRVENSFREPAMTRIAAELRTVLDAAPDLQLLLGHGSGSFGHVAAKRYNTISGVRTPDEWRGFAEVGLVASELNFLVAQSLNQARIPVLRIQPSASARASDGELVEMALTPIRTALEHGLTPLVYGDVALDAVRGGTIISTEKVFFYLARHLPVTRIILLGEVDGVYDPSERVIEHITPDNLAAVESSLAGSSGVDVTGGMESKVRDMVALAQAVPNLSIRIMSGLKPGLLRAALLDQVQPGTLITT
ncbi:MAG: isopentenyl phosphate kinase [Chloroflexota bacterium]|nr:isopentenyl phosphate kinase [Chloroflexota bacterium]